MTESVSKPRARQAFFLALLIAAAAFLPYVILNRGYFFFYGDFNVQQVPFYQLAHRAVRSGEVLWNWKTDLGANFIGSYSFYLLFSPFFWLTLPFPNDWVPYLMAPLLMLKTACASLTGYWFIQRFVKDKAYAVLGGLLYAFSGFMTFNIFFNHFHEVVVFFPLLLISLEELVINRRRGVFALSVALCAMVNYWFFIGEVVFVILYFCLRCTSPQWKMSFGRFCSVAFEAVLGLGLAMFVFLPSVLAILGNPRTTSDNIWTGWQFWLYTHEQRQPAILQSLFFPPELPSRPNFLPDHGAKWSSLSAWLPLVGMTGVIAYLCQARRDWLKKTLLLCLFIAMVPGLNSLFIALNNSYYARWFYMPILLMCLASALAFEQADPENLLRGARWNLGVITLYVVAIGLTPEKSLEGDWHLGLYDAADRFWAYSIIAIVCAAAIILILVYLHGHKRYRRALIASVSAMSFIFTTVFLGMGTTSTANRNFMIETALGGREQLELPQEPFARTDFYECMENLGMYWDLPNIQAFHSIVPVSLMKFYPEVGVKRDVSSKPEAKYYALRSLLSVRWLFIDQNSEKQTPMPDYSYYGNQLGYNIYQNDNFIPMGFTYRYYITRETFDDAYKDERSKLLLKAMLLEDEALERNGDILTEMHYENDGSLTEDDFRQNVRDRRSETCSRFEIDATGFSAAIDLSKENLVFFSVPYDPGWSATVNGVPVEVEQVNVGFMAVRCPAGHSEIRFDYMTYGLPLGALIALCSGAMLVLYLLFVLFWRRRHTQRPVEPAAMPPMLSEEEARELATLTAVFNQPVEDPEWQQPQVQTDVPPSGEETAPVPAEYRYDAPEIPPVQQPEEPTAPSAGDAISGDGKDPFSDYFRE